MLVAAGYDFAVAGGTVSAVYSFVCALVVGGMWLERYLLVVPSVWSEDWVPFGGLEALITLGFLAAAALCYLGFARTFPLLPLADLEFQKESRK